MSNAAQPTCFHDLSSHKPKKMITSICWCPPLPCCLWIRTYIPTQICCCCDCIVCIWTPLISLQVMSRQWPGPGSTQMPGSAFVGLLVIATIYNSQHYSTTTCYKLLVLLLLLRSYKSNLSQYRSNNPGSSKISHKVMINLTSSECVICGRVTPGITRATALRALLLLPTD
jgi:hypothetical protein